MVNREIIFAVFILFCSQLSATELRFEQTSQSKTLNRPPEVTYDEQINSGRLAMEQALTELKLKGILSQLGIDGEVGKIQDDEAAVRRLEALDFVIRQKGIEEINGKRTPFPTGLNDIIIKVVEGDWGAELKEQNRQPDGRPWSVKYVKKTVVDGKVVKQYAPLTHDQYGLSLSIYMQAGEAHKKIEKTVPHPDTIYARIQNFVEAYHSVQASLRAKQEFERALTQPNGTELRHTLQHGKSLSNKNKQ
jgi:hypothetical protein